MAVSKVILNGETLMDVTVDTVTSEKLLTGYQATGRDGVKVQGAYVPQSVELAAGSADPSESAQHITPPSGYDGFEYFDVSAVSSNYIGSNIAQRSSSDLTTSGSVVTAPSGYYAAAASKAINAGSATTPATSITTTPAITVSSAGLITATVNSSKSITPTVSAGYISSGTAGTVTASGSNTSQLSTQSAATINPTESVQTAVASGKYTTGVVSVGAISSNYVGSNIPQNDSSDLTASGSKVTVPSGYYAAVASKTIAAGSAKTPATTITANPGITVSATGLITATNSKTQNVTPTVTAGYVSAGTSGTITVDGSNTSQLSTQAAVTITPTESSQTAVASGKYTTGVVTIGAISSDYVGSNIAQNSAADLSASGSVVTVPSGYYAAEATKVIAAGSVRVANTQITPPIGTINVDSTTGKITVTRTDIWYDATVMAETSGYIDSNTTTASAIKVKATSASQSLSTVASTVITPTESSQTAVASGKYTLGPITIAAIPSDYIGSAIASIEIDEGITTVSGTTATRGEATWDAGIIQAGNMGAATFANTSSGQTQYVDISNTTEAPVLVSGGYLYINKGYTDDLKISLAKLVPDGASADLASSVILSGYAAYDNDGNLVAGNIPTKSSANVTVSGPTVSVPSGYYASAVSTTIKEAIFATELSIGGSNIGSISVSDSGLVHYNVEMFGDRQPIVASGYADRNTYVNIVANASKDYQLNTQAAAAITPTESSQIAVASGKYTLGDVTVAAVSSNYIGSNVTQNSAADLTASGSKVTVPSGYYAATASKAVAAGTATTPATTITANPGISVDSSTGVITATTASSKSITPTISAGYINTGTAGTVTVSGTTSSALSIQAAATINPTESEQTAVAAGKYTTGVVKVGAISSNYIGSNIAQNSAADVVAAGPTVTIPSGYYGVEVSKEISSATFATQLTLTAGPNITLNSATGLITGTNNIFSNQKPLTISGYADKDTQIWITTQGSKTLQLDTLAATTYTPSTSTQTISSGVYLTGTQTIAGDTALVASNIIQGATIFGVVGTAKTQPTLQSKTVTPSSTSQVITFDNGYDGLSSVTIEAIPISVIEHRLVLPDGLIGV